MLLGALFAVLSSFSFGLNTIAIRRGVLTVPPARGLYVSVIMGVPLLAVAALITGQLFELHTISLRGYLLLAAAGISHFLLGRYANYRTVAALGANRAAPVRELAVPVSVMLALLFLGERITWLNGLGIALVMAGPAIMWERPGTTKARGNPARAGIAPRPDPPATVDAGPRETQAGPVVATAPARQAGSRGSAAPPVRLAEGYFWGVIAALVYGSSPPIIRAAIGGTGLGIAGALVSYASASALLLLTFALPGRWASLQQIGKAGWWFALAGLTVFFAQMFRYVALDLAPVTVVSPLQQTGALFTVFLSFLVNRHLESFGPRVLVAIALAVSGSVLVVR